ncbi:Phosphoglycolate phosphatase (PGPase)-like protein [Chara braunii]|uniref:Phosphoglycolate phosphatase (PGPase)-like protein n=1 Tax=Chara braunii TaxID=69332 RepID=A0A388K1M7_CHABU|nr:Phosphoglycolate phosphatase (PGPase)-like protein [Chara braunii]|eukprot:GBG63951.1 Phosphoglycolate phosphatase (PGPase)-like protein [Chara braunii]
MEATECGGRSPSLVNCGDGRVCEVGQIVNGLDNFLFDCDGVLWHGEKVLDGIIETLSFLRSQGKRLFFVTNNATKSRKDYLKKFQRLGIYALPEEIYTAGYAAAAYLKSLGFKKTAFVIGASGLEEELTLAGIKWIGGTEYPIAGPALEDVASSINCDPEVGAVIVSLDWRCTYEKIAQAASFLRRDKNCVFVGTNPDPKLNTASGVVLPGAGSLLAAVETTTGRKASVVGKPEPLMLDLMVAEHRLDRRRTGMVGDALTTDIPFGKRGGLTSILVMSGVTTRADFEAHRASKESGVHPDFVLESAADILRARTLASRAAVVETDHRHHTN